VGVLTLADDPSDPGRLYAGTFGLSCTTRLPSDGSSPDFSNLYISGDGGTTWVGQMIGDKACAQLITKVVASFGKAFLLYPSGGVGWSTDAGITWILPAPTSPATSTVTARHTVVGVHQLVVTQTDPPTLLVDTDRDPSAGSYPGYTLARSEDGGITWDRIGPPLSYLPRLVVTTADSADTIVVSENWNGLWRTDDGARSWTHLAQQLPPGLCDALVMSPSNSSLLYMLNHQADPSATGLWRSDDGGVTWRLMHNEQSLLVIAMDRRDAHGDAIAVATSTEVIYSSDGGSTFVSLGRPAGEHWIPRVLLAHGDALLIGTDDGIWQTALPAIGP
jgi:photosystem II stability/assembly factor-like uncharacterized protein